MQHLLAQPNWRVVIADIRPEAYTAIADSLDVTRHTFVHADVSSWDSQAALFKQAYAWSGERIDFFAANAGTSERGPYLDAAGDDLDAEPTKPDTLCTEVNQFGPFYGLKLFVHYSRKTTRALKASAATGGGPGSGHGAYNPKVVITSSCSALYAFPVAVQYAASKAAIVSLVRGVGKNLLATDNVAVNCIMPAYVDTGLTPKTVTALIPKAGITPISTMTRAFMELIAEDGRVAQDGKSDGKDGKVKVGQAVECVLDKLYYRKQVEYADESQKWMVEQSHTPDGVWMRGIMEMVKNGALQAEAASTKYLQRAEDIT